MLTEIREIDGEEARQRSGEYFECVIENQGFVIARYDLEEAVSKF